MLPPTHEQQSAYALSHSVDELERLIDQARFFGELTAQVLQSADLSARTRVLDIGCKHQHANGSVMMPCMTSL